MFSVTLSMAGGLIAGKEGPFIHAGGIVGGGWAGMGSRSVLKPHGSHVEGNKKQRKEKITPLGADPMRSQVSYWASPRVGLVCQGKFSPPCSHVDTYDCTQSL